MNEKYDIDDLRLQAWENYPHNSFNRNYEEIAKIYFYAGFNAGINARIELELKTLDEEINIIEEEVRKESENANTAM